MEVLFGNIKFDNGMEVMIKEISHCSDLSDMTCMDEIFLKLMSHDNY